MRGYCTAKAPQFFKQEISTLDFIFANSWPCGPAMKEGTKRYICFDIKNSGSGFLLSGCLLYLGELLPSSLR